MNESIPGISAPEILAPAGNKASFLAAVAARADAVYCGLKLFSARMEAKNFTLEEFVALVRLAHQKGVAIETVRAEGTPNQEMKRIVEEMDIDLLVIGEIAQVRSRRDEFYNETERAMRRVSCSVLVVKDEDRVWDLFESS